MQSIQFGCALLQDETEVTFVWLFETWLGVIGGRPPTSIITDQDLAMKGAIAQVFPNTRHRLCIWHIKKKFVEKLSQVYFKKSKFKKEVKKFMGTRYNRGTFFAGMNTTGRSEGVNLFFDDFVTSTTNLKEFVVKYDQALKRIVKRKNDEDFESEHKFRIVNDNEFLLKLDIDAILDYFILPRWRQKANKFRIIDSKGLVHDDGKKESGALRPGHMCQESTK
ncbi:hypothetical protein RHMOL_Rhmol05G0295600 [Rhododendron molle]|uniref:Uncharacterized protein n=1 Tax=Rhododendron molle TaxID=49168 RepID=A0ACC0NVD9_RHOML|nr:hypothetical protein RHMOL_Rhmol05G0295600 [Rhododendron molle]